MVQNDTWCPLSRWKIAFFIYFLVLVCLGWSRHGSAVLGCSARSGSAGLVWARQGRLEWTGLFMAWLDWTCLGSVRLGWSYGWDWLGWNRVGFGGIRLSWAWPVWARLGSTGLGCDGCVGYVCVLCFVPFCVFIFVCVCVSMHIDTHTYIYIYIHTTFT